MTIKAKIIADSISPQGIRITTMQLRYPRFIHAEFMTHRVFSRNASSSRAIPVERMISDLRRDPAMPVFWGSNKPGMQAGDELTEVEINACKDNWLNSMENAIHSATQLIELGLHKQIANRMLEPWAHINVVVTATDYENFFNLRCHPDAQPEIQELAIRMRRALAESEPIVLHPGDWHLPYITSQNRYDLRQRHYYGDGTGNPHTSDYLYEQDLLKISVARCARVSYLTHDGRPTLIDEDVKLYDRLVGSEPLHASPAEHQASPDVDMGENFWREPLTHGNFRGWRQYRKILEQQRS